MALGECLLAECTFNVTKQCVRGFQADECTHRGGTVAGVPVVLDTIGRSDNSPSADPALESRSPSIGGSVLDRPPETPRLPGSGTLGIDEATRLMTERYTTMVGIVGLPASGKTACLVSAYLLLSRNQFTGFSYSDSLTLMAFEEIARGSRRWNLGDAPTQMTLHTEMADDRTAGFLHLRLNRDRDDRTFDLLLPDLPGEWSRALIDSSDAERFDFLKSATVVWLMVDGRQFADIKTRGYATYRAQCLVERLANVLASPRPRIMLVPSWKDSGEFPQVAYDAIREEGKKWDMNITLAPIASFSQNDQISPGEGLADLIERTVVHDRTAPSFWPKEAPSHSARSILAFRAAR